MTDILYDELYDDVRNEKFFTLVDLRTTAEIKDTAKLPNAKIIPVQELEAALKLSKEQFQQQYGFSLPAVNSPDSKSIVWYCRSGRRVGVANQTLQEAGFSGYRLYYGSFLDWTKNGGPTDTI